jgi:hypothetical protein
MKKTFIIAVLVLSACAPKPRVKSPPCDMVNNRVDVWVCGKADVMKSCRKVDMRKEYLCDEL